MTGRFLSVKNKKARDAAGIEGESSYTIRTSTRHRLDQTRIPNQ